MERMRIWANYELILRPVSLYLLEGKVVR
uniref:Uncharacterized protein n=1 Tax=Lepeophtheirus salmonis TaxID=72036 RepID=A0A0K2SWD0_LEPSM